MQAQSLRKGTIYNQSTYAKSMYCGACNTTKFVYIECPECDDRFCNKDQCLNKCSKCRKVLHCVNCRPEWSDCNTIDCICCLCDFCETKDLEIEKASFKCLDCEEKGGDQEECEAENCNNKRCVGCIRKNQGYCSTCAGIFVCEGCGKKGEMWTGECKQKGCEEVLCHSCLETNNFFCGYLKCNNQESESFE